MKEGEGEMVDKGEGRKGESEGRREGEMVDKGNGERGSEGRREGDGG